MEGEAPGGCMCHNCRFERPLLLEEIAWLREIILDHVGTDAEVVDPDR